MKSLAVRFLLSAVTAAVGLASGRCSPFGPGSDLVTVLFTNPGTTGYQATAFDSAAPASFTVTAHLSPGATFCGRTHLAVVGPRPTIILVAKFDSTGFVSTTYVHVQNPSCAQCLTVDGWTWDARTATPTPHSSC